jgi:hypothetical protein
MVSGALDVAATPMMAALQGTKRIGPSLHRTYAYTQKLSENCSTWCWSSVPAIILNIRGYRGIKRNQPLFPAVPAFAFSFVSHYYCDGCHRLSLSKIAHLKWFACHPALSHVPFIERKSACRHLCSAYWINKDFIEMVVAIPVRPFLLICFLAGHHSRGRTPGETGDRW